jgi:hypothetical protein
MLYGYTASTKVTVVAADGDMRARHHEKSKPAAATPNIAVSADPRANVDHPGTTSPLARMRSGYNGKNATDDCSVAR